MTEEQLRPLFEQAGPIAHIMVIRDRQTDAHRGNLTGEVGSSLLRLFVCLTVAAVDRFKNKQLGKSPLSLFHSTYTTVQYSTYFPSIFTDGLSKNIILRK